MSTSSAYAHHAVRPAPRLRASCALHLASRMRGADKLRVRSPACAAQAGWQRQRDVATRASPDLEGNPRARQIGAEVSTSAGARQAAPRSCVRDAGGKRVGASP